MKENLRNVSEKQENVRLNKVNLKKQRACDLNWLKDV